MRQNTAPPGLLDHPLHAPESMPSAYRVQMVRNGAVMVTVLWAFGCHSSSSESKGAPPSAASPAKPAKPPREMVAERYRLGLDKRVLIAVADIDRLLGGTGALATATWQGGRWLVKQNAKEVGQLSELPSYAECARLLDAWAAACRPGTRAAAASPVLPKDALLGVREAFALARAAGARLTADRKAALADGAHALASLALQIPDPMGRNDALGGRALAVVSLARAEGALAPADEVLVASALGYGGAARTLATSLPAADPVRAFAFGDEAALEQAPSLGARLLRLRQLIVAGDRIRASAWMRDKLSAEQLDLGLAAARLEMPSFDDIAEVAAAVPAWLALHARREAEPATSPLHQAFAAGRKLGELLKTLIDGSSPFAKLDEAIARLPGDDALGPFLKGDASGRDLMRGAYRALGYAAVHARAVWAVSHLASMPAADAVAEDVARPSSFADAAPWVRLYRSAKSGSAPAQQLVAPLEALSFSHRAVTDVLDAATARAEYGGIEVLPLARVAVRSLDTRLWHRNHFSYTSLVLLADSATSERLARSVAAEEGEANRWAFLHVAGLDGKLAELRPKLADPRTTYEQKSKLLSELVSHGALSSQDLLTEISRLGAPKRWGEADQFIRLLEKNGQHGAARKIAEEFLRAGEHESLNKVMAQTAIARTMYSEKRYAEAWKVIEPTLSSWQGGAMMRGALILQALGRGDEAIKLAEDMLDRYPTAPNSWAVVAEIHWRAGRPAEAARRLAAARPPITNNDWNLTVGPRLADAVDAGADGKAALAALAAAGIDPIARLSLIHALNQGGKRDALVADLYRDLRLPGMMQLEVVGDAGKLIQRLQGPTAAAAYVKAQVPPQLLAPMSQFAFDRGLDEVLWSVVPLKAPGRIEEDDCVWYFRAAASLRAGAGDPHRAEVLAHYRGESSRWYQLLGSYLIGKTDEAGLLARATAPKELNEAAYFIGYKADVERRLEDAIGWYRVTVELGSERVYETRLALARLSALRASGKSLARLAALPMGKDIAR